jgi:hypothetical protein
MESSFIANPSEHGYIISSMHFTNVPVHKIQSYFTNCVAVYMNHSFLVLVQMQQFCLFCCNHTSWAKHFLRYIANLEPIFFSLSSACHLCVARFIKFIQPVTWNLFVHKKIVFCVEMMYQVTASQFLTFFVEIWCIYHKQTCTTSVPVDVIQGPCNPANKQCVKEAITLFCLIP